jgi:acetyl-CoA/propionyl-CoA carboxylase biotin carboxyl carrier protein
VQAWKVNDGAEVAEGESIAVMEAMKMEMQVFTHRVGCISIQANARDFVVAGAPISRSPVLPE